MNVFEMVIIIVVVSVGGGVLMKLIDAFKTQSRSSDKAIAEEGDQALRRAFVEYRKRTEERLAQIEKAANIKPKKQKPLLDQEDAPINREGNVGEKQGLPNMLRD